MTDTTRKLASIRRISALEPIEGADRIECATVDGWKLVTAKVNRFNVGDLVVYFEIDSWIPCSIAAFLDKNPKTYEGVVGARLRTIKLRGQISQGLILPIKDILVYMPVPADENEFVEGYDLTAILGIKKWEKPINAKLAGIVKGNFPSFIPKTDEERVQNMTKELAKWTSDMNHWDGSPREVPDMLWEVTEKLEGSSMTVYWNNGQFGVCSRNLELVEDETNAFWKAARSLNLERIISNIDMNIALQGELVGPGVQGNYYGLSELKFYIYNIYDIDGGSYVSPETRRFVVTRCGLDHVPVLGLYNLPVNATADGIVSMAEGRSILNNAKEREGIVFKHAERDGPSFKAISNKYLLNND
jgi:RNA ligase (TIGR02306 family)